MATIVTENLKKNYGKVEALRGVSLSVGEGELFGLIGPDGAGKTTLFRTLTTLIVPDSGRASVLGLDPVADYEQVRRRVGYMPGRFSLYPDLSVKENLSFFAAVFGTTIEENYDLVRDIYSQIEPFKDRRAKKLSGGMKQKLALSCALIHRPEVLFLDEPTTGVDPVSRQEFWEMLKKLKQQGISILVSTPYMDEATLCDRIALMQNGLLLDVDTPAAIIEKFQKTLWAVRSERMHALLDDLRAVAGVESAFSFGAMHHATVDPATITPDALKRALEAKGHRNVEITAITPTVEDCFMELLSNPENRP